MGKFYWRFQLSASLSFPFSVWKSKYHSLFNLSFLACESTYISLSLYFFTALTFHVVWSLSTSGFDCSSFFDAQQVLCKRALDIFNSVLSKKYSCRQLWLFHECSDICHVPALPGCSALKLTYRFDWCRETENKTQPIVTQKWGLWKMRMVSWPVLSLKIALL